MAASGWWEAFAFVWVIGFLNLTYAAGIALGVHPTAFLLEAFLFGGLSLILIAKPGANAHRIIFAPQTWGYGGATILGEIFYYLMIAFVPPADASVFMRVTILLTILMGWLVVGCIVITVMQYLMFSSVVKITSENFFAVASLSPLATLILQEADARLGLVGAGAAGWGILPFILLILVGNLLIAWRGGAAGGDNLLAPTPEAGDGARR